MLAVDGNTMPMSGVTTEGAATIDVIQELEDQLARSEARCMTLTEDNQRLSTDIDTFRAQLAAAAEERTRGVQQLATMARQLAQSEKQMGAELHKIRSRCVALEGQVAERDATIKADSTLELRRLREDKLVLEAQVRHLSSTSYGSPSASPPVSPFRPAHPPSPAAMKSYVASPASAASTPAKSVLSTGPGCIQAPVPVPEPTTALALSPATRTQTSAPATAHPKVPKQGFLSQQPTGRLPPDRPICSNPQALTTQSQPGSEIAKRRAALQDAKLQTKAAEKLKLEVENRVHARVRASTGSAIRAFLDEGQEAARAGAAARRQANKAARAEELDAANKEMRQRLAKAAAAVDHAPVF